MTTVSRSSSSSAPTRDDPGLPPYVEALLRPDAYAHPADDLRLHETHISWVVLAGAYAYKVKKPVNFGFLDFSTVERRAAVCADEVRLNRRLAPDVYLGVESIRWREGRYFMGGEGRPVEPSVWMRRLPEDGMLTHLLARGEADARLMRRIPGRLARFHARAGTGPGVDEYGAPDAVRANWAENFAQTERFVGLTLSRVAEATIKRAVFQFLDEREELLLRRVREGRIRDGHGDLHAGSICLDGNRLIFFDCIEFSPRYRCSDVAAEVAFLAMDLDHYGRGDLAETFVAAYVRASGDQEMRRLLPFYQCYRAYVRGKVQSLRLLDADLSEAERARVTAEARAYFDLAWAYAGGLRQPALIALLGPPESGSGGLADGLARRLGLVRLSLEEALSGQQTARAHAALRRRAALWLRRGRSVILQGRFDKAEQRAAIRGVAARLGVPVVWLLARPAEPVVRASRAIRADPGVSFAEPPIERVVVAVDAAGRSDEAEAAVLEALRQRLAPPQGVGFPG